MLTEKEGSAMSYAPGKATFAESGARCVPEELRSICVHDICKRESELMKGNGQRGVRSFGGMLPSGAQGARSAEGICPPRGLSVPAPSKIGLLRYSDLTTYS